MKVENLLRIQFPKNRIFGLDLLRAAAIVFVVLAHGNLILPPGMGQKLSYIILDGVSIFFVLSGFLIGGIIIRKFESKDISWNTLFTFWKRRWFRTLPNYFLILFILALLHFFLSDRFTIALIPEYIFFIQNVNTPHPWFFPEAWSLSIEEWFYLFVPFIIIVGILLVKVSARHMTLMTVLVVLLFVTLFRYDKFSNYELLSTTQWDALFRKQILTRLDSIMYGVLGAYLQHYKEKLWIQNKSILLVAGCVILLIANLVDKSFIVQPGLYKSVFSFSIISIGTLFTLPFLSNYRKESGAIYKSITLLSLISYSMYLVNLTLVQNCIIAFLPWPEWEGPSAFLIIILKYGVFWGVTIVLSIIIYKYYEFPFTQLREKNVLNLMNKKRKDLFR